MLCIQSFLLQSPAPCPACAAPKGGTFGGSEGKVCRTPVCKEMQSAACQEHPLLLGAQSAAEGVSDGFPTAALPQGSPGLSLGFNRRAPRPLKIITMPERNSCSRLLRLRSRGICLIYNKQFSRRELCTRSKAWTLSETLTQVSKSREKSQAISNQASAAFRRARPVFPVQAGSLLSAARNREVQSRRQPYSSSKVLSASPAHSWAPATPHVPVAGASGAASQGSRVPGTAPAARLSAAGVHATFADDRPREGVQLCQR